MRIVIHIDSDDEFDNAESTAHAIQNHPELQDADGITIVADHLDSKVTTVYPD